MRKFNIKVDGVMHEVEVEEIGAVSTNNNYVEKANIVVENKYSQVENNKSAVAGSGSVVAPLQGTIQTLKVNVGDKVNSGDVVVVIEAMKMENDVPAPVSGTVKAIYVSKGSKVASGDVILDIA